MPVLTESHVVRLHPVQFEIHIPSRAGSARPTALMSSRRFVVAVLVVSKSCHRLHSRHDSYAPGGRAPCQDLSQNLEQESRGKISSKNNPTVRVSLPGLLELAIFGGVDA